MRKNSGFTLVEVIVVLTCLGLVTSFFWSILNSASEDSYTINDKVAVQNSVTSLMNIIQRDIQEASIFNVAKYEPKMGIMAETDEANLYVFNTYYNSSYELEYSENTIEYRFDEVNKTVTRKIGAEDDFLESIYNDIVSFEIKPVLGKNYGAEVNITGGKKSLTEEVDKSRYKLNSSFYTRNTQ